MINWKETVMDYRLLSRGRSCFDEGGIVGLNRSFDGVWNAIAVGSELYRVNAQISNGKIADLSCSCPYATKYGIKQTCKHEAALFYAMETLAPGVLQDDDSVLSNTVNGMSADATENALQLAIDTRSTRCAAILLNHKNDVGNEQFSPDEFTLDDLPADAVGHYADVQGDNDPLRLLFGNDQAAMDLFREKYLT